MKGSENTKGRSAERKAKAADLAAGLKEFTRQASKAGVTDVVVISPKPKNGKGKKDDSSKGKKVKKVKKVKDKKLPAGAGKVKQWSKASIPIETKINNVTEGPLAGAFASVKLFGHSLTSVLRAAGKADLTAAQMRVVFDSLGLQAIRINQIRDKISRCEAGKAAPLTRKQLDTFRQLAAAGKGKADIE